MNRRPLFNLMVIISLWLSLASFTKLVEATSTHSIKLANTLTTLPASKPLAAAALLVTKTANPTNVPEYGENVDYTVQVRNASTGGETVIIFTIIDDRFGNIGPNCSPALPVVLNPGSSIICTFTRFVSGDAGTVHTNVVTASGVYNLINPVSGSASANVTITDVPSSITVAKNANPALLLQPGGLVSFTVRVDNTSLADSVTINSLSDSIHGNLNGRNNCSTPQTIPVGGFYECAFTATVSGSSGYSELDLVTASGLDDDNSQVSAFDDATVTITGGTISKISLPIIYRPDATHLSVFNDQTGGNVTFAVMGTSVSCTVPNNTIRFCGSFPPGTYNVQVSSMCGSITTSKIYHSGPKTTRVFCQSQDPIIK